MVSQADLSSAERASRPSAQDNPGGLPKTPENAPGAAAREQADLSGLMRLLSQDPEAARLVQRVLEERGRNPLAPAGDQGAIAGAGNRLSGAGSGGSGPASPLAALISQAFPAAPPRSVPSSGDQVGAYAGVRGAEGQSVGAAQEVKGLSPVPDAPTSGAAGDGRAGEGEDSAATAEAAAIAQTPDQAASAARAAGDGPPSGIVQGGSAPVAPSEPFRVLPIPGSGGAAHQAMGTIEATGEGECPLRRSIQGIDSNLFILAIPAAYFQQGAGLGGGGPAPQAGPVAPSPPIQRTNPFPSGQQTSLSPTQGGASLGGGQGSLGTSILSSVASVGRGLLSPGFLAGLAVGGAVVVGSQLMKGGGFDAAGWGGLGRGDRAPVVEQAAGASMAGGGSAGGATVTSPAGHQVTGLAEERPRGLMGWVRSAAERLLGQGRGAPDATKGPAEP